MTKEKFQATHSAAYAQFLLTPCGQAFLSVLSNQMPGYEFAKEPHLFADNRGARRGYESCLRNIVSLSVFIPPPKEVEATYGVPDHPMQGGAD